MGYVVTDYCVRCAEPRKNVFFEKFHNNSMVVGFARNGFNPFGDIIDGEKNIQVSKRIGKRSHKVDAPNIKDFDRENGV